MKILDIPRSGSFAGSTSSRNRFGQYVRSRATPVNPKSPAQVVQRSRQTSNAVAWRSITAGQRAGWGSLGTQMVRTDALGQSYALTGFQAYCSINNVRAVVGLAVVADAPILTTPAGLVTVTLTLTSASFSVAYTTTPLAAANYAIIRCSSQRSAGRTFEADYRVITVTAAAAASPANILAAYTAKFGVPVTGNKIFCSISTSTLGFESPAFLVAQIVA
jgi:hypothetical protein